MLYNNERIGVVTSLQKDLPWLPEIRLQDVHSVMKLGLVQILQEQNLVECFLDEFLFTIVVFEQILDDLLLEFWVLLIDDTEHVSAEPSKSVVVSRLDRSSTVSVVNQTDFSEMVTFAKNPHSNLLFPIMFSDIDQAVSSCDEIHGF